jgi:hypothetical protein
MATSSVYVAAHVVPPKLSIEIVHDPEDARRWVAIDCRTRQPVLRFFSRDQLE